MMNYTEFKNELTDFVRRVFANEGLEVLERETLKNNTKLDGLVIDRGPSIASAVVYINSAYEDYVNGAGFFEVVCNNVIEALRNEKPVEDLLGILENLSTDKLELGIMQIKGNEELINSLAHYDVGDTGLAVYLIYRPKEDAIVKVTNELASHFFESKEDLMNIAMLNMKNHRRMQSLESVLFMINDYSLNKEGVNIVRADSTYMYGAALLADCETLNCLYDVLGNFVILPSSIYEFLVLKIDDKTDFESLKDMVKTVNDEEVAPDDILSYDIYTYIDRKLERKEVA